MPSVWFFIRIAAIYSALVAPVGLLAQQAGGVAPGENALREYDGVYQWSDGGFLYLQLWSELTGKNQLVAFDEAGDLRALYPSDPDHFFTGPGAAVPEPIESRIRFERDRLGKLASLVWVGPDAASRVAHRVEIEKRTDVRFASGPVELAGTLISPTVGSRHPAVILVHPSGAADREYMLPFARFLIRRGFAVLGYDKRGVGGSGGNWREASFEDLAKDVVAAFEYLKSRPDIDSAQIGLLGWSQAGWIMPLAAVRAKQVAFLISVSGAGVSPAETTIDQARNEMTARGMKPETVEQIIRLMQLQYEFARTRQGWEAYASARDTLIARIGQAPESFPATPSAPHWASLRLLYFFDPTPILQQLQLPTLALFGELDNNIIGGKNKAAWDSALTAAGNPSYSSLILPKANHLMLEAVVGSNAEMPSLRQFVPSYFTSINEWLAVQTRKSRGTP